MTRAWMLFLLGAAAPGCRPDLGDPESLITGTRILAVRADPPESSPGAPVSYDALVVTPAGTVESPPVRWAFCASPKPLTENDAVSTACLASGVRAIGGPADSVDAATPTDACQLFGPDPPPGNFRPRDPDVTGGFYQPVRLELGGLTAFALERITCNLPNAPVDVAIAFAKGYRVNRSPKLGALTASVDGAAVAPDHIPAGSRVELATSWEEGDAETYVRFDPDTGTLVEEREALRLSWFVTAGALDDEVTGRDGADHARTTATTWRAPAAAGVAHLWMVLRDSRGGVDFTTRDLIVIR
jgi:hypothetical protein